MTTAELITSLESCDRRGFFGQSWQRHRMSAMDMLHEAIKGGLVESERQDYGEKSGEITLDLATNRGLDLPKKGTNIYDSVLHHACLADILVTAIRKPADPPWLLAPKINDYWQSSAFISPDGSHLRRIVCVSHWSEERLKSELRSWFTLGECSMYGLPMQMVIAVVGQMSHGFRSSHWTKGVLHPKNHTLRFQTRQHQPHRGKNYYSHGPSRQFNERWIPIKREDHAEFTRDKWLEQMLADDCMKDLLFVVDIPAPSESEAGRIKELAIRKLERLHSFYDIPEKKLSGCESLLSSCPFLSCCWSDPECLPEDLDFDGLA